MPHDVTMPQLGMAQDAGKIVSWLKAAGDPVKRGDALFEVETDKATMEVEAQADGFLTGIQAVEGQDVPVGAVIARITETAQDDAPPPPADAAPDTLPAGRVITMPQLGMAQDTGLLVGWLKSLGEAVAADDILFEVETDKSTMEVPAGATGYLAATLADAGQEVPVGATVAILSAALPDAPVARSAAGPADSAPPEPAPEPAPPPATPPRPVAPPVAAPAASGRGRILASPRARRLALEQGLDLARLVRAGHPQPFHVRDLETLRALPADPPETASAPAARVLTAQIAADGLGAFVEWAGQAHGLDDADAILAGFAGAAMATPCTVAVARHGRQRGFGVPAGRSLSAIAPSDAAPDLILRDLRSTPLRSVSMGAEPVPVLTLTSGETGLTLTLECSTAHMDAEAAITLISEFAGRLQTPLRHLL